MQQYFTLEEANALLPRLAEMMAVLQEKKRAFDECQKQLAALIQAAAGNGRALESEARQLQRDVEMLANEINALVQDVQGLGCEVKDLNMGLVDFRSLREGREVYLCWRLGEATIAYWHELHTGFAGRQLL